MKNTIYAPSSAVGGSIAVLRVSGTGCRAIATQLFTRDIQKIPRVLSYSRILHKGRVIDEGMAVFFPAPHSYTGEDMLEIHCHGGWQTVQQILAALAACGASPAAPGEFTRRAFLNGKMDLTQAEAVMDVINAQSEQSLAAALRQLQGQLFAQVRAILDELFAAQAGLDAAIDYPEEVEEDVNATLPAQLEKALSAVQALIADGRTGRKLRDGIHVVLCGRPNVGKSSLLNALCGEDRAIVTETPGTTRDILDVSVIYDGVALRFFDTAGIRQSADAVEQIGINRARQLLKQADMVLLLLDSSEDMTVEDAALLSDVAAYPHLVVGNKSDLDKKLLHSCDLYVSAQANISAEAAGRAALLRCILDRTLPNRHDESCITNERHIFALEQAELALQAAIAAQNAEEKATDLRDALHALACITGDDVEETIIDQIFENFCVGK